MLVQTLAKQFVQENHNYIQQLASKYQIFLFTQQLYLLNNYLILRFQQATQQRIVSEMYKSVDSVSLSCYKMLNYSIINEEQVPEIYLIPQNIVMLTIKLILLSVNLYYEQQKIPPTSFIAIPSLFYQNQQLNNCELLNKQDVVVLDIDQRKLNEQKIKYLNRIKRKRDILQRSMELRCKILTFQSQNQSNVTQDQLNQANKYQDLILYIKKTNRRIQNSQIQFSNQQNKLSKELHLINLLQEQYKLVQQKQQTIDMIRDLQYRIGSSQKIYFQQLLNLDIQKYKKLKLKIDHDIEQQACGAVIKINQLFLYRIYRDKAFLKYIQQQFIIDECYCGYCQQCKTLVKYYKKWIQ